MLYFSNNRCHLLGHIFLASSVVMCISLPRKFGPRWEAKQDCSLQLGLFVGLEINPAPMFLGWISRSDIWKEPSNRNTQSVVARTEETKSGCPASLPRNQRKGSMPLVSPPYIQNMLPTTAAFSKQHLLVWIVPT